MTPNEETSRMPGTDPEWDSSMRTAQVVAYVRQTPVNAMATVVASGVTGFLLWPTISAYWILTWIGTQWLLIGTLLYRWIRHRQSKRTLRNIRPSALRRATLWAGLSGGIWGAAVFFLPYLDTRQELTVIIVMSAMIAGAATTLAAIPLAASIYIAAIILPAVGYFLSYGNSDGFGLATMALTFGFAMLGATRSVYRLFLEQIQARNANSRILEEIGRERQEWLEISDTREAFALFDREERLLTWNRSLAPLLSLPESSLRRGVQRRDLLQEAAAPVLVREGKRDAEDWIRALATAREPITELLENGRWIRTSNRKTKRGYTVTTFEDITESAEAEEAARQAASRLEDAIASTSQAIIIFDKNERVVLFNDAGLDYYPETRPLMKPGLKFEDLIRSGTERGAFRAGDTPIEQRLLNFREGKGVPTLRVLNDGRRLQISDWRMRDGGTIVVATDVTELMERENALRASEEKLRLSEEYFRALIENSSDIITLIALDGKVLFESPSIEPALGYRPDDLIGTRIFDILHPDDLERAFHAINDLTKDGQVPASGEFRIRHRNGEWRHFAITATNALEIPSVNGIVLNARDVTELKQREEELHQAQKMEAVGQLTGGIAHDFNNILAVTLGNLQLLAEQIEDDEKMQKLVDRAVRATERGAALTHRLLAFSRRQSLRPQPTDIGHLVIGLQDLLGRTLGANIEISTHLAENLPQANIDPNQVESAILNLALNARDAMPGGGRLVIETSLRHLDSDYARAHPEVSPGDYVALSVSDTGLGMSPDILERVFEPFFTTKGVGEGTGLGLSMVYGFIKQSGGHITIYSEPGNGTTIRMHLPVVATTDAVPAAREKPRSDIPRGNKERILVVEDDQSVGETAKVLLDDLGYVQVMAKDVPGALEILRRDSGFAVLFTDIVLPGEKNGLDLAREVASSFPGIRILCTSGYTENTVFRDGPGKGEFPLLDKPYRKEVLAQKLRNLIVEDREVT